MKRSYPHARMSLAVARAGGDDSDVYREKGPGTAWADLYLGFFLVMRGELEEAEERLRSSLEVAERSGDIILRACDLYCLVVAALRRNDNEAVHRIAHMSVEAGISHGWPEMASAAKGCLAWLAWQEGDGEGVLRVAGEAEDLWRMARGPLIMWKWTYLWPLVAVYVREGQIGQAVEAGCQMLEPSQQRLPDELEATLAHAGAAWASEDVRTTKDLLCRALELAHLFHFF